LLLDSANNELGSLELNLKTVVNHLGSDLDEHSLNLQLRMLLSVFGLERNKVKIATSLQNVIDALLLLGDAREMFGEVNKLLRLILTMPVSNATAERSFSALRRLKTYTRSTICASRLSHTAVLHVHKKKTAAVVVADIGNMFVAGNDYRFKMFGHF